ncbi:MAG: hypothetical protein WED07_03430 [Candidatus Freyarchaeum deiterrae]
MVRTLFWSGILIFIPSWAFANGLLFLPSTSDINNIILVLSFVELAGITLLIGGLLLEFEFQTYWKKIVPVGVVILLVGYWVMPFIISFLYPQVIALDFVSQISIIFLYPQAIPLIFVSQISTPPLWARLVPAATEITGTLIILLSAIFSPQKNEKEK